MTTYAIDTHTGDGSQTDFTLSYNYFEEDDLIIKVDNVTKTSGTDYSIVDGSTVRFTSAPANGTTVTVERATDIGNKKVTFSDGGTIRASDMNNQNDQLLFAVQEASRDSTNALRTNGTFYDAGSDRIANVGTPTASTDATTKAYVDQIETDATQQATNAAASASASAVSATASADSATTATTQAGTATTQAGIATTKANEASASATTALSHKNDAETAKVAAELAETNAETAEINAETAEAAAVVAKNAAVVAQGAAETAETNAETAKDAAVVAQGAAETAESNAATSEGNAATSEGNAATSAGTATTKAAEAVVSANAASGSATAAANSAAAAAAAFDNFDDTYLGSFSSDPTVDNDGDALVEGALYFNSSANEMRVYDGANWIAASSAGTASILGYNYTATAGQTTFTGSDDNSATLSYTAANLMVTLNGILLENGTDYAATNGTSIVLTVGAAAGDELNVIAFKSFTVSDTVAASTGGTFNGNVAVNGDLTVDTDTLFVDASADAVGINTTTVDSNAVLGVNGRATFGDQASSGTAGAASFLVGANSLYIQAGENVSSTNAADIRFTSIGGSSTRMLIGSSGNVGIGNTAPSEILDIKSTSSAPTIRIHADTTSSPAPAIELQRGTDDTWGADNYTDFRIENSDGNLKFFGGTSGTTSEYMRLENDKDLHVDGNVVAYSTTISDIRLKKDIAPIEDAVTKVQQLNGCTFTYLKDDRKSAGLIAQDVEKVLPSAVIEDEAVFHGEEGETYKTVQYDQVIGLLVEAVKELSAKVEELENASSK